MTSTPDHAGLSNAEAARRLLEEGPNELPGAHGRSLLTLVLATILEPIFLLLTLSAGLYLALGDRLDALTLMSVLLLMCGITVVQA
jgi:Ca2+-transporting ATPase